MANTKCKPSVLVVFLTVFIDLTGFGVVVPSVPIDSRHCVAGAVHIGAIMASFSAMPFLCYRVWGRLCAPHGRQTSFIIAPRPGVRSADDRI